MLLNIIIIVISIIIACMYVYICASKETTVKDNKTSGLQH